MFYQNQRKGKYMINMERRGYRREVAVNNNSNIKILEIFHNLKGGNNINKEIIFLMNFQRWTVLGLMPAFQNQRDWDLDLMILHLSVRSRSLMSFSKRRDFLRIFFRRMTLCLKCRKWVLFSKKWILWCLKVGFFIMMIFLILWIIKCNNFNQSLITIWIKWKKILIEIKISLNLNYSNNSNNNTNNIPWKKNNIIINPIISNFSSSLINKIFIRCLRNISTKGGIIDIFFDIFLNK